MKAADKEMRQCELHLEECDAFLRTSAESVNSEVRRMTQSLRDHNLGLRKEKDDLQQHFDMVRQYLKKKSNKMHKINVFDCLANSEIMLLFFCRLPSTWR